MCCKKLFTVMFLFLVLWLLIRRQNWRTSVPPNSVALFLNYHQCYKSTRAISHNSDVTFVLTRWTAKFLPSPHWGTRMNHESFSSLFFSFSMVGSRPGISWIWLFTHNGTVTCLFKVIAAMLHWNQILKKKSQILSPCCNFSLHCSSVPFNCASLRCSSES